MYDADLAVNNKDNNFNLIRLILSIGVICSHAFDLFPSSTTLTFADITQAGTLGECCIYQFFGLSGFLIFHSFLKNRSFFEFLIRRFLRLWPGLFICVTITTIALGPLTTQLNIIEYFRNNQTFEYWLGNISLYTVRYNLPGVFTSNYYKEVVNGSIWSLRIEFICYLMLLFSSYLVYRRLIFLEKINKALPNFTIILLLILYILGCVMLYPNSPKMKLFIELKIFFIIGMIFYLLRAKINFNIFLVIILITICIYLKHTFCYRMMFYLLIFYLLYCLAFIKLVRKITKFDADLCYGVYIYGFPTQQLLNYYAPSLNSLSSLVFTIPIVLVIAYLSWHIIEKPCIRLVLRFRSISYPLINNINQNKI